MIHSVANTDWQLASTAPLLRRGLCSLAQPLVSQTQRASRFVFAEPTIQLIVSGQLDLSTVHHHITMPASDALLFIQPHTCADIGNFRSIFLSISHSVVETLPRGFANTQTTQSISKSDSPFSTLALDADLSSALQYVISAIEDSQMSEARLRLRLQDLLMALAEKGNTFHNGNPETTTAKLRAMISEEPSKHWTAQSAGKALAMSPATLRRRLAEENTRFEHLLVDIRMHHAMMLFQTTNWHLSRIAEACGYRSTVRFNERFQERFGAVV
ncbi:helix-turn-helix transcriptional regulator [Leeia sp. TBRC 13508]|uniref:Helix-turn-helix transcriptional regulator n=1 Tax=Leeia speluncae TaxID=2884804 RepID=A0ABS8D4C9_9NEIS|nr:helix-turn-helix transcriptional regulator [Leeia speluncae]MCB6183050.1 helix-turn-helix transcriptional regulator [Leeia speluncae]